MRFLCAMRVFKVLASSSPLGYLCAKFCFFRGPHCWASPWRKIMYSLTESITQLMPRELKLSLRNMAISISVWQWQCVETDNLYTKNAVCICTLNWKHKLTVPFCVYSYTLHDRILPHSLVQPANLQMLSQWATPFHERNTSLDVLRLQLLCGAGHSSYCNENATEIFTI